MKTRKQKRSERDRVKSGRTGIPYSVKKGFFNEVQVGRTEAIRLYLGIYR